jgi:hypothetical protein
LVLGVLNVKEDKWLLSRIISCVQIKTTLGGNNETNFVKKRSLKKPSVRLRLIASAIQSVACPKWYPPIQRVRDLRLFNYTNVLLFPMQKPGQRQKGKEIELSPMAA